MVIWGFILAFIWPYDNENSTVIWPYEFENKFPYGHMKSLERTIFQTISFHMVIWSYEKKVIWIEIIEPYDHMKMRSYENFIKNNC